MKKRVDYFKKMLTYLINTRSHQSYNSRGDAISPSIKNSKVKDIFSLSNIIGRMEVYEMQEDKENFEYMEKFFLSKCDEFDIDIEDFEDWLTMEDELKNEDSEDDNCETCVQ